MADHKLTLPVRRKYNASFQSPEYLERKAKGRPMCLRCLIPHFGGFGACKLRKKSFKLLSRDPEAYAQYRYKRMMKKPRKPRNTQKWRREEDRQSQPLRSQPSDASQGLNAIKATSSALQASDAGTVLGTFSANGPSNSSSNVLLPRVELAYRCKHEQSAPYTKAKDTRSAG